MFTSLKVNVRQWVSLIMQNDPLNLRSRKDFQSKTHTFVANKWFLLATAAKQTAGRVLQKPCWDLSVTNRI